MSLLGINFFYKRFEVGTVYPSKAQIEIPFTAQRIVISNESQNSDIEFSFNGGSEIHGELFKKDTPLVMDGVEQNKIWFKKIGDGADLPSVRVWAWRKTDV